MGWDERAYHGRAMPTSDDDLKDVLREECSRGRKQPVNTEAERRQREREARVLEVFRYGTEHDLRELLELLRFSEDEIREKISAFRKLRGEL